MHCKKLRTSNLQMIETFTIDNNFIHLGPKVVKEIIAV